jgi:hypothetical protein
VVEVVDDIVSVEVCAEPLMVTGLGDTLQPGAVAPVGMVVTAQVRVTAPVNPNLGVAVMVDVLPDVAACRKLTLVGLALNEKVGTATATLTVVVWVMLPDVPVTVMT